MKSILKGKVIPDKNWGYSGLGRFLPKKSPPKAQSSKKGLGRSRAANKMKVVSSVPVHVVAKTDFENDPAMVKKYGNSGLEGQLPPQNPNGKKRSS